MIHATRIRETTNFQVEREKMIPVSMNIREKMLPVSMNI